MAATISTKGRLQAANTIARVCQGRKAARSWQELTPRQPVMAGTTAIVLRIFGVDTSEI